MRVAAAFALTLVACGRANFDLLDDGDAPIVDADFGDAPITRSCNGWAATCGQNGTNMRAANRSSNGPTAHAYYNGARCARR